MPVGQRADTILRRVSKRTPSMIATNVAIAVLRQLGSSLFLAPQLGWPIVEYDGIVNVWRPIRGPVQGSPPALCDARRDHLVAVVRVRPQESAACPERFASGAHLLD